MGNKMMIPLGLALILVLGMVYVSIAFATDTNNNSNLEVTDNGASGYYMTIELSATEYSGALSKTVTYVKQTSVTTSGKVDNYIPYGSVDMEYGDDTVKVAELGEFNITAKTEGDLPGYKITMAYASGQMQGNLYARTSIDGGSNWSDLAVFSTTDSVSVNAPVPPAGTSAPSMVIFKLYVGEQKDAASLQSPLSNVKIGFTTVLLPEVTP